jgi:phytoene synthase
MRPWDTELTRDVLRAYDHCRRITRQAAKTFYWGSLLLPRRKRLAAWALYAFCRAADDRVDQDGGPGADAALERWRERLRAAYRGVASDPITVAWVDMLRAYPVPLQPALDLIDGVQMDLRHAQPQTFEDLHLYSYRVAGTVGLLMAPILGYRAPAALPCAVDLGIAMQLTNILRDVGEDWRHGRCYLPRDEMDRFGYTHADLANGVVNDNFVALMRYSSDRAHEYYRRARPGIDLLDSGAQLAILASAEMYRGILPAIAANGYDVFTRRAHVPTAMKARMLPRLWLQLRATPLELELSAESPRPREAQV